MSKRTDWYNDSVIYELHVRSFFDSNRDGIGDFAGLMEKLPYLKQLGVNVLWLLPFYPSPLKTQGHDITDFKNVHPHYGSLEDFRAFLAEAHRQKLRVVIDLVMNHTSNLHPWFERARRARAGSPERDFYVWSDTPEKFKDARVIYKDFESSNWSWDPVAGAYYWHRFFQHQPDLNFDNPLVHEALLDVVDFWLDMGVDGLRLKGTPYLYAREGTSCENLPEVHNFLRKLRKHVDKAYPGRVLFARAKLWAEEVASYYGKGDECQVGFNFPLMPKLFMSVGMEDRFPIVDVLEQMPSLPKACQWANFLRDHDDLTLEMVTDEERDYMYRTYAKTRNARVNLGIRRRLAPLMGNNRRKIELMNGLLFSMPGVPVIYYGDEIGMGDNFYLSDRNGLRTPFQWSSSRNAGFSRAPNAHTLYLPVIEDPEFHYETVNVEAQEQNPHSLLNWMRELIAIHQTNPALTRGDITFLHPANRKILVFIREHEGEKILVVANLSSLAQYVELDLAQYSGMTPIELFGKTAFPTIGNLPYFITLAPYSFHWFSLQAEKPKSRSLKGGKRKARIELESRSHEIGEDLWNALEKSLPETLLELRWFGGKARPIRSVKFLEKTALGKAFVTLFEVHYTSGEPETYALPVALVHGSAAERVRKKTPQALILELELSGGREAALIDATYDSAFRAEVLRVLAANRPIDGGLGKFIPKLTRAFEKKAGSLLASKASSKVLSGEQSNTSINFDDRFIFKLYRKLAEGTNPDVEIGRFLTDQTTFRNSPSVVGTLEFVRKDGEPITLGGVYTFVANEGDAWSVFQNRLNAYLKKTRVATQEWPQPTNGKTPAAIQKEFGEFLAMAELLGRRTFEMHVGLGNLTPEKTEPAFLPEPFTLFYQRALYQSMRKHTDATLNAFASTVSRLEGPDRAGAELLLESRQKLDQRFRRLLDVKIEAQRIRTHGDYHLGQVLFDGKDFIIIDYEGEPARSLSERKFKRSALRDVAGMLRSFHYASYVALDRAKQEGYAGEGTAALLKAWHAWTTHYYLKGYFAGKKGAHFLPSSQEGVQLLLDVHLLEKALYELTYEINNRPAWVKVPLTGILELLEATP